MTITPDDKDWTWVIERPCEQCGFDASNVRLADAPDMIRSNARQWSRVLSRDTARRRPREDRWSDLEYACHVRDVYTIFDQRLALMLTREDPVFENWDQDATAVEDRYDLQDPSVVLDELQSAAERYAQRCDAGDSIERERLHRCLADGLWPARSPPPSLGRRRVDPTAMILDSSRDARRLPGGHQRGSGHCRVRRRG